MLTFFNNKNLFTLGMAIIVKNLIEKINNIYILHNGLLNKLGSCEKEILYLLQYHCYCYL